MSRKSSLVLPSARSRLGIVVNRIDVDNRGRQSKGKKLPKKLGNGSTSIKTTGGIEAALRNPEPSSMESTHHGSTFAEEGMLGEEMEDGMIGGTSQKRKTPNQYLGEWLAKHADSYLSTLFHRDAPPVGAACPTCHIPTEQYYRCNSCVFIAPICKGCLLSQHQRTPLHQVETWNGTFWSSSSLAELGLVLQLGHPGGSCSDNELEHTLRVGDLSGFSTLRVKFCTHPDALPKSLQLLSAGLMCCSDISPQSAFTVAMLEHFAVFGTLGKCSAHKYYAVLERLTNTGFPGKEKNRYRELLQTQRKYSYLMSRKRSGVAFETHPLEFDPEDQALQCVACPRPGFNYDPQEVIPSERGLFRNWGSFDGNFRNPRKAKRQDPDNICLTDGTMYYVKSEPYLEWVKSNDTKNDDRDKTKADCDNHKASKDRYVRFGGVDESGVGACTCTRHSCFIPKGLVDFWKGERFAYGDYAIASFINYVSGQHKVPVGLTYDIWCHWIPNLHQRAKKFPSHIRLPDDLDLVGGIPKFHLPGHQQSCHDRYSLNYMQDVGRMEGEGCERAWSYLNETSGSTSEKGPGARRDAINHILADWNFDKMIEMGDSSCRRFLEAKRMYTTQLGIFEELHQSLPPDITSQWMSLPLEAKRGTDGKWTSVFSVATVDCKFQEVIQANRAKESAAAHTAARRPGATQWLANGIELESAMKKVRDEELSLGEKGTGRQHDGLNAKRKALNIRINSHREDRAAYMGDCEEPDHPERRLVSNPDPEHSDLGLPSSYSRPVLEAAGLGQMADLEAELRRGVCNEGLESVRNLLGAKALTLKFKKANIRGEGPSTRAEAQLRQHSEKIHKAQWRYNNSREALFRLGATNDDEATYQRLVNEDLKYLQEYMGGESQGIGQGRAAIPWIWRRRGPVSDADEERWQAQALKVEWFRSRERYKRWEEELKLLKREMVMSYRDFQARQKIWEFKASSSRNSVGMSQYAAKKANFFKQLSEDLMDICRPHVKDPIVTLKWSEDWLLGEERALRDPVRSGASNEHIVP